MSLHKFISTHAGALIERTRAKIARRSPHPGDAELEHGVPIFLSQLASALEDEERSARPRTGESEPATTEEAILRSARLHDQELSEFGFAIEQVIHDFGDVCQAVTELALEQGATVTVAEYQRLDRCLDNAIAGALASWNQRARSRALSSTSPVTIAGLQRLDRCLDNAVACALVASNERARAPVPSPAAVAEAAPEALQRTGRKAEREPVFVVDRDPHVRRLVQTFVGDAYAVEFLDDGRSALDRVRRSPPCALITEILIPQIDGLALCRLLKGDPATKGVPILVSSTLMAGDRARQAGADGFLEKPLERTRLIASLRGLADPRARRAGGDRRESPRVA